MGRVAGKVAFITGAARGQGRSHAIRFAEEGADIIAIDICEQIEGVPYPLSTPDDLKETVEAVEALGQRIVARKADVRELDQLSAAVADGVRQLGRLDIVCANAGIVGQFGKPESQAQRLATFRRVVDINLTGVYLTIEAARDALIDSSRGGSIIITSSLAGLRALRAGGGYSEAKHGLVGLMRGYAHDFAPHMIRVNSVHPTNVATPMILNDAAARAFRPDIEDPTEQQVLEVLGSQNLLPVPCVESLDVSNAVLFLASEESRYITGVALPVDAGAAIKF